MFTALALIALRLAAADTTPAAGAGAYLDAGARSLVEEARARRESEGTSIERYRTLAKSRISLEVHALGRDRLFYRCESAIRVDWRRGQPIVVEVVAGREALPMVSRKVDFNDDDCVGAVFDPADDRLNLAFGGLIGSDSAFVRHPLAPGSEADYRFRSGDTTTIRLPDGRTIGLLELQLLPRRSDPHLVSGSLWLERDSRAVVRAVLKLARPYDFVTDAEPDDGDEEDDDVPGMLRPLRGDVRFLSVEYGLYEQRWWLPRLIAVEGQVQVGSLGTFPLRAEESYSEYEVEGTPPGSPRIAYSDARPTCKQSVSVGVGSSGAVVDRKAVGEDSIPTGIAAPPGTTVKVGCECSAGRCFAIRKIVPTDTAAVLHSDLLPPSIYEEGDVLVSEGEMKEILARVESIAPAPWQFPRPDLRWGWGALDLVRYDRVEGLSVGARARADLGRATVDGTVRLGVADLEPNFELGATRTLLSSTHRVAAYHRLESVGLGDRSLGFGASLGALLFGRDDGDYYRTLGAEFLRRPAGGDGLEWRVYAERQTAASNHTDFSFAHALGGEGFRPNIVADDASQLGAELDLRASRGLDPAGWRGSAVLSLRGEAGDYRYARPSLSLLGSAPLPAGLVGSLSLSGGTSFGEVPTQGLWYLGGPGTVRGYGGNSARGGSYWLSRAAIATAAPGARLSVFSDAGWAGARDAFAIDPLLLSAGVGASFLDGLLHFDLARALRGTTGWRVDLHVDAPI
jgi:hypothetical protein